MRSTSSFSRLTVLYKVTEFWLLKVIDPSAPGDEEPNLPARLRARGFSGLEPLLYTFVSQDGLPP